MGEKRNTLEWYDKTLEVDAAAGVVRSCADPAETMSLASFVWQAGCLSQPEMAAEQQLMACRALQVLRGQGVAIPEGWWGSGEHLSEHVVLLKGMLEEKQAREEKIERALFDEGQLSELDQKVYAVTIEGSHCLIDCAEMVVHQRYGNVAAQRNLGDFEERLFERARSLDLPSKWREAAAKGLEVLHETLQQHGAARRRAVQRAIEVEKEAPPAAEDSPAEVTFRGRKYVVDADSREVRAAENAREVISFEAFREVLELAAHRDAPQRTRLEALQARLKFYEATEEALDPDAVWDARDEIAALEREALLIEATKAAKKARDERPAAEASNLRAYAEKFRELEEVVVQKPAKEDALEKKRKRRKDAERGR